MRFPKRYLKAPIACHLLGYLNGEGEGVAGLELAYEEVLHPAAGSPIQCVTSAKGALLNGSRRSSIPAPSSGCAADPA